MVQRSCIGAAVALFVVVLFGIGCSRDGVLEAPDSGITVTTLEAIHGSVGHLAEFTIGDNTVDNVDRVVLQLQDSDISDAVLYLSLAHTTERTTSVSHLITLLKRATGVSLVPALPDGIKQQGGVILSFGDTSDPSFLIYLRIVTPTDTVYWSVRGNLSNDRRDWFLQEVRKPPRVIDTGPAQVVEVSYYQDAALRQPLSDVVLVGEAVYTKVVFSKNVPIILADDSRARPRIRSVSPTQSFQYRMRPRGSILASGDAQPYQESRHIFVGMYRVVTHDFCGEFFTSAGHPPVSGRSLSVLFYR